MRARIVRAPPQSISIRSIAPPNDWLRMRPRKRAVETSARRKGRPDSVDEPNAFGPQRVGCGSRRAKRAPHDRAGAGDSVAHFRAQQVGLADELRGVGGRRFAVNFTRRSNLLEKSGAQQRNAIGKRHGFFLVVRHENET